MVQVSPINIKNVVFKSANYNAVKIQINDPKTNLPEGVQLNDANAGKFNAVNIEVNRPVVDVIPKTYTYPENKEVVVAEQTNFKPIEVPKTPVNSMSYPSSIIDDNNENFFQNESEVEDTTLEEKKNNGLNDKINFQAISEKNAPNFNTNLNSEIILNNLNSKNYDVQAQQMEEITRVVMTSPENAVSCITTNIFDKLIEITLADTSNLEPPSKEQIALRRKIIINEIIKENAKKQNKEIKDSDLPYEIKKEDIQIASKLSPLEQAERNKEYSLYTMAVLTKLYIDETKKRTGNIVPLTDLPGVSVIVDTIRYNENPSIKIAAIDSLRYLKREEYNNELNSIFEIASMDKNQQVSIVAIEALKN